MALMSLLKLVACVAVASVLVACGSSGEDAPADSPAATGSAAFPVTVEHRFGSTTVESEPERVVVLGLTEQDIVLQLGVKPVATTEWYGEQPYAVWPWAQSLLGDAKPTVLKVDDGYPYEKIAALRPDLIIAANAGLETETYKRLTRLAPVIATPKGGTRYFAPWDDITTVVATALGKREEGEKLIADVKAKYAAAAKEYPEFKGKTATFAQNGFYNGVIYVYQDGLSTEFLSYLGFTINPKLTPLVKARGEQVQVSEERADVLDADAIVFATETPKDIANLMKVPTVEQMSAVTGNRSVYTDPTLAGAIYFSTPLSLTYVLEHLTPQLEKAVAGKAPREIVDSGA